MGGLLISSIHICECDFGYQYVFYITSFEKLPVSNRTISTSQERNAEVCKKVA